MGNEYEDGRCYMCHKITRVRRKNLFTVGSEGTNLCIECEKNVIGFMRDYSTMTLKLMAKARKQNRGIEL